MHSTRAQSPRVILIVVGPRLQLFTGLSNIADAVHAPDLEVAAPTAWQDSTTPTNRCLHISIARTSLQLCQATMSVPGMARRYRGLVLGGAAAAAFLGSDTSVALAESKKKDDSSAAPYFDPEALERGAKALREINASPHAKQASQSWSTVVTRHLRASLRHATDTTRLLDL